MDKDQLRKAVNAMKNISLDFMLDTVVFSGEVVLRGIILNNPDDVPKVKSLIDADILKAFKFRKSKAWYLGDAKEVILMQLKEKMGLTIPELENFEVNNYA